MFYKSYQLHRQHGLIGCIVALSQRSHYCELRHSPMHKGHCMHANESTCAFIRCVSNRDSLCFAIKGCLSDSIWWDLSNVQSLCHLPLFLSLSFSPSLSLFRPKDRFWKKLFLIVSTGLRFISPHNFQSMLTDHCSVLRLPRDGRLNSGNASDRRLPAVIGNHPTVTSAHWLTANSVQLFF